MKKALSKKNLWDKMPSLVKTTMGRGLGILPPAWLLGKRFQANCRFVREAQRWPAEHSREYQLRRLQEILKLAYEKTEFYHRMFDSIGFKPNDFQSMDCTSRLPAIDKQIVTKNLAQMFTRKVTDRNVDFVSTGGTSAAPSSPKVMWTSIPPTRANWASRTEITSGSTAIPMICPSVAGTIRSGKRNTR